ncbi:hypothetical protein ABZW03_17060 [Kitasatospora sp. NPDC004799]|uniref:hypothetical protein n=1 Tax=Kitasatospora sp. NPDC004799 TaxID=3154460 RepID=UPI0033ACAEAD
MTAVRRKRIVWGLRGAALAALLAYAAGWNSSRSGGLVVVEHGLNHPLLLGGSAVLLVVVSLIISMEFRTWVSQIGCAIGLIALVLGGIPVGFLGIVLSRGGWTERTAAPGHSDRVLTVTDVAFSIDPIYKVELVSGTGWSARHWSLGTWDTEQTDYVRVDWSGPDRITITRAEKLTVFDVRPDGSLGAPREEPRPQGPLMPR